MLRKIVSALLITCLLSATGVTCFATTGGEQEVNNKEIITDLTTTNSDIRATLLSDELITDELITNVDPYISLDKKGSYYINDLSSLKELLSEEELIIVNNQLETMNQGLAESNLSHPSVTINQDTKLVTMNSVSKSAKEGVDKIEMKWYGVRVYMSKTTVTHLLNLGVVGGGVALGFAFPGVGEVILIAISGYVITEFGATGAIAKPIYVDVTLNAPNIINPTFLKVSGMGFQ